MRMGHKDVTSAIRSCNRATDPLATRDRSEQVSTKGPYSAKRIQLCLALPMRPWPLGARTDCLRNTRGLCRGP